jgi:2-haloacid dehalogenase
MRITRRDTLRLAAGGLAASAIGFCTSLAAGAKTKVIAFDPFPIFDPRPIFAQVQDMLPEKGERLNQIWRTRQFEYTWLRTLAGEYIPFWEVTRDALRYAARAVKAELTPDQEQKIMGTYLKLKA